MPVEFVYLYTQSLRQIQLNRHVDTTMMSAMQQATYKRFTVAFRGDKMHITLARSQGPITIVVPASHFERWCLRLLRSEALS